MKKTTKKWLDTLALSPHLDGQRAAEVLDSDARQRAEIRDLKNRLALVAKGWEFCGIWIWEGVGGWPDVCDLSKPLKTKRKATKR